MRKLFLRSTLTYVFILCLALLFAIPVSLLSLQSVRRMEITKQQAVLNSGIETLEDALLSFHRTSQILLNDNVLSAVAELGDDIRAKDLLLARDAQQRFRDILLLVPLQKYSAIVFHQSNIVIDQSRLFTSVASYYGFFYQHGRLSVDEWQEMLFDRRKAIKPEVTLHIYERQDEEYILYKIPLSFSGTASATFFLCISKADIARLLMSSELTETGMLELIKEGEIYLSFGRKSAGQDLITADSSLLGMMAAVGLVQSAYQVSFLAIQQAMLTSAGILILIGMSLSLGFAYRYTTPLKRLLRQIKKEGGEQVEEKDVYRYIESSIRDMDISITKFTQRINDMNAILRHNDFEQVVYGYPQMPSTRPNSWISALAQGRYCLLLMCIIGDSEGGPSKGTEYTLVATRTHLEQLLPKGSFQHVLSNRHIIVLVPIPVTGETPLNSEIAMQLIEVFDRKARIVCSYPFTGAQAVPDVFWGMRRKLSASGEQETLVFCEKTEQSMVGFDFGQFQRIYYTLSTGSYDGLKSLMEQMDMLSLIREMNRQEGMFYFECLYASLRMVATVKAIPLEYEFAYDEAQNLTLLMEKWMQSAQELCDQIIANKKQSVKRSKEDVKSYVDQHFSNPQLCIAALAEHFSIKPKQVSALFLDLTGMHYSDYVEDLRLTEASKQIEATNQPIQEISAAVGFATLNTFYKAFRRRFSCSPSIWRQKMQKTN